MRDYLHLSSIILLLLLFNQKIKVIYYGLELVQLCTYISGTKISASTQVRAESFQL